jgi:PPOX class probable F420-dependent enzyme
MSDEEITKFLMFGTRTAKLSTIRKDGSPHVVPIWFVLDNNDNNDTHIVFTTGHDSLKANNMTHEPRVCICVDDQIPPFSFVKIDGIAEINQKPPRNETLKWTTRIAERYMKKIKADSYGKRNSEEGELLVRIKPTRILAEKNISEW